jgi:hypothetical protein
MASPNPNSATRQKNLPPKGRSNNLGLVSIALLLLAGFVLVLAFDEDGDSENMRVGERLVRRDEASRIVDHHLKKTDARITIEQQRVVTENFKAPQIGERVEPQADHTRTYGVQFDDGSEEAAVARVVRPEVKDYGFRNPAQIIQNRLADEQLQEKHNEAYDKAYIEEFIANARRNGYEVQVNDKFEVIKVTPIPQKLNRQKIDVNNGAIR